MASPDPEWLLWREQYKIHSRSILEQLSFHDQGVKQIGEVTTDLANLISQSNELQAQNDTLRKRIATLEENNNRHQKPDERLMSENNRLRDRIVRLEQDANQQDQINAMHSEAKGDLELKLKKLKADFVNVIEAVGTMQKTTRAEREGQRKELLDMKERLEACVPITAQKHPPRNTFTDCPGVVPYEPTRARAVRETSQATTADESMQIDHEKDTQLLDTRNMDDLPDATQLYTQYADDSQPANSDLGPQLKAQGSSSIEEYINHGNVVIPEGIRQYESRAVKIFVQGLRDKYAQQLLENRLEMVGWTWEKAKEEIQCMLDKGRKRRENRRTMPAFA